MNAVDYLVLAPLAVWMFFALRRILRSRRKGSCCGCCAHCAGKCASAKSRPEYTQKEDRLP